MDAESRVSTLLGDPRKAILAMFLPILLSLMVSEVNTLADRAWCSGLGVDALATISVVRPIYNVYVSLGSGLGVGAAAVIARKIGAGRSDEASSCGIQAMLLALITCAILTPVMYLAQSDLLHLVGSEDIHGMCMDYMTVYTLSITLIMMNGVIAGILNGQGAARLSTAMMVTLAVGNMILDPIFIYVLDMGILGASAATVTATVVSISLGIYFMLSRYTYLPFGRNSLHADGLHMREVGKAGIPQMLEFAVIYGMDAILNMIVIMCAGSEGLALFCTPDAVVALMIVPGLAIESALVSVASSAYGQRDPERMKEAMRYSVELTLAIILVLVVLVEIMPSVFMMPFTYSGEMEGYKDQLNEIMRILALYAPMFALTPVCSAFLQAMKYPTYSVIIAIVRNIILIVLYLIAAQISLTAICWFLVMGHAIGAVIILAVTGYTAKRTLPSLYG